MITCLFDIDGTLLSSGGAGKAAIESALCEDFDVELCVQVPYSGRTDRAIMRDLFRCHAIAETPQNQQRLVAGYLARLPDRLRRFNGRVLPGIVALLKQLQERPGIALGLLTGNLRAGAKVKLGHFGLHEHFLFGGYGDEHFERDEVAREALRSVHEHVGLHCKPERMWVIGDTPLDVQCARAIGARAVAVATGSHSLDELRACAPDLLFADLSDPQPLLRLF